MPFQTHCPSCQKNYMLADELGGKYVRCQECQQSFRAVAAQPGPRPGTYPADEPVHSPQTPSARMDAQDANPFNFYDPPQPQRAVSKPLKKSAPWVGGAIGVIFLLRLVFALMRSTSSPTPDYSPQFHVKENDWQRDVQFEWPKGAVIDPVGDDSEQLVVEREFTDQKADEVNVQLMLDARPVLRNVAFSPDGERLVCGNGRDIIVWDVASGRELRRFPGGDRPSWAVGFLADGKHVLSGRDDGSLLVWSVQTGEVSRTFNTGVVKPQSVVMSLDRNRVVIPTGDGAITQWDVKTGKELARLLGHPRGSVAVAFTPDGTKAVSADTGTVRVWDLETGKELSRHTTPVNATSICVSPDGNRALIGADSGSVQEWNLANGEKIRQFQVDNRAIGGLEYTSNGRCFLATCKGGMVRLWNIDNDSELALAGDANDWSPADQLTVNPKGTHAVVVARATTRPKLLRLPPAAIE
jgi:predicted Zn finger-like uncharacterized protein